MEPVQRMESAHVDTFCRDHLPPVELQPDLILDVPGFAYPERLNCATALLDTAAPTWDPGRTALISAGTCWTYEELADRAARVAQVLAGELGIVPGNRVLLRSPNNAWLVAAWLGVLKAGAVPVTTMAMLRARELRDIIAVARPSLAICDARYTGDLDGELPPDRVVTVGADRKDDLVARCEAGDAGFVDVATLAEDVALIAFTSGTTGPPKATMHLHRDVLAIADTFGHHLLAPQPTDIFAGSPPLGFTFGLGALAVIPLRAGATSVLLERCSPMALAHEVAARKATVLFTSPTAYRSMLLDSCATLLSSVRIAVSAGEPLSRELSDRFHAATGLRLVDGIGSTEMLHIFISGSGAEIRPGSTGRPVPGYQAEVQDREGRPVPDGTPGLLAVRGPTGCRYLGDAPQSEYVRGGWNIPGDIFVRDADGYFWHQGRIDDMIVSGGYNISGAELENTLLDHRAVHECAVVGAPDPERGAIPCAFVVLAPGFAPTRLQAIALQAFMKRSLAPYKYPRRVEFIEQLPRNNTGKVRRNLLRDLARSAARPPAVTRA